MQSTQTLYTDIGNAVG